MRSIGSKLGRRGLVAVATACASLGFVSAASAATYTVNDTRDLAQSGTASSGACVSTASTCTLRAAITASNQNGGPSSISLPAGTYPINSSTSTTTGCTNNASAKQVGTDLNTGSFKVNPGNNSTQITVIGAGSGTTVINAQGNDRIFDLFQNGVLDVQKMTLENGTPGGCSRVPWQGGAIDSSGHLASESVTFTGNSTTDTLMQDGQGGAVAADNTSGSTASLTGSVFQNNTTTVRGGAVYSDSPNDVTLAFDLFQANTSAFTGGAILGDQGSAGLTLNFDDFVQNVGEANGGALSFFGTGAVTVTNSLFSQNQSMDTNPLSGAAGAILMCGTGVCGGGAHLDVSNSSFDGNSTASFGGAIADLGSNGLNLTQDRFSGNSAAAGGALELHASSTTQTQVLSSEFDSNSTPGNGGAIDWGAGPLTLLGGSFVLNSAADGAGLFVEAPASAGGLLTMVDSTMSRNTATSSGGGIFEDVGGGANEPHATLTNDTIAFNNAASGNGGGVAFADDFASGGSTTTGFGIENTTIAENSGGDCEDKFTATFDVGNNNDSDQTCFGGVGGPNDQTGVNPLLSNPANNGGPVAGGPGDTETVQTDAEQASSPTVDAGNNSGCPTLDERGVTRPQGKACDIGAYEFGASPTSIATSTTGTTRTTSTSTRTSTTVSHPQRHHRCAPGKVRRRGKCVKKRHRKPRKCRKGTVHRHGRCVKK